ncbi:MAG: hypothetical protein E6Q39_02950 [Crocinitomicaceae bacterium]|nr:MAG: hypothetical protein E6Q39_02950 [Crocinitomicaceae bacterium]
MRSIIFPIAFLLLTACNNTHQSAEAPATFEAKQLIAMMQNPQSVSKESIAGIAGTDAAKIKIYNEDFAADVSKRTILFSWANGDKKTVKTTDGRELQLDGYSSLGLGFVTKISKADFQKKYESKTAVQDEINRITKDETVDADIAIAEAKGLAENAKTQQFEKLDNVGELSYWETPVNALHVFVNGISFTVTTNLENEKRSKEKAIALTAFVFSNPLKSSK